MNRILRHIRAKYLMQTCVKEFDPIEAFAHKKIAVIGSADSALKYGKREIIEEADIVIRINRAPHSWNPEMLKSIGKRTDILFHSFYENATSGGGIIDFNFYKDFGIKKLVNPNNNTAGQKAHLNFYKRHKKKHLTFLLESKVSQKIKDDLVNHIPTVGFYALASCLMAETESVYITGFTFFKTPYYKGYRDHLEDMDRNKMHIERQGIHNPELEFINFQKYLAASPSKEIILDNYLESLLQE